MNLIARKDQTPGEILNACADTGFDGIADRENIASRPARPGYAENLSFELKTDAYYADLPMESCVCQCYRRACRVAAPTERALAKKAAIL